MDRKHFLPLCLLDTWSGFSCITLSLILVGIDCHLEERGYPKHLGALAQYINEPGVPFAFSQFLYSRRHPNRSIPDDIITHINFMGKIQVFHSAITRFYSPSDLYGAGGMYWQRVRSNPSWYGHPHHDTVFVVLDELEDQAGMKGLLVARVHLLFSFIDDMEQETVPCALVSWFVPASDCRDPDTGM